MSIIESNADDIRPIIKDIKNKMNKINEEKNNIRKTQNKNSIFASNGQK